MNKNVLFVLFIPIMLIAGFIVFKNNQPRGQVSVDPARTSTKPSFVARAKYRYLKIVS